MKLNNILYLFLILFLASACREEGILEEEVIDPVFPQVELYVVDVQGLVKDQNGNGVSDAEILIGTKATVSDNNGFFLIENVQAPSSGIYLSASKQGYLSSGKHVYPDNVEVFRTNITITTKTNSISFDSNDGLVYDDESGASVEIAPSSISLNGSVYNGSVVANMEYLSPLEQTTFDVMPGNLQGMDEEDNLVVLQSLGMISVELESPDGQKLQITDGQEAKLNFPNMMGASAPSSVPLWHFNETTGIWEEEGSAELSGNEYNATVGHFSWWNCDIPIDLAELCITIFHKNGEPVQNLEFVLTSDLPGFGYATANTANGDTYCNIVPEGVGLAFNVFNVCGDIVFTAPIGSYTGTDNNIEITYDPDDMVETALIAGTVTNCSGSAIESGYVTVDINGNAFVAALSSDDQEFEFNIPLCDDFDEATVMAVDLIELNSSTAVVTLDSDDIDQLSLTTCVQLEEVMTVIDEATSDEYFSTECTARQNPTELLITSQNEDGQYVILGVKGSGMGIFEANLIGSDFGNWNANPELNTATVEILTYGQVGGQISGRGELGTTSFSFVAERIN